MALSLLPTHRFALALLVILSSGVFAAPAYGQPKGNDAAATREFIVAVSLQNKQLYAQAEKRWLNFIRTYAKDAKIPHAYHHLGACYLHQDKFTDAAQTFRVVVQKFPKFESRDAAQFNLGLALYGQAKVTKAKDDYQKAARAFAQVHTMFPKSPHAATGLYYQGEAYYSAKLLTAAETAYQKLIDSFPKSPLVPDVYYALGTMHQEQKNHAKAVTAYRAFLRRFDKNELASECQLRLAQALFAQNKYNEAAPEFGRAAKIKDFDYADFALIRQGRCYYELTKYQDAARVYEMLPQRFPKSAYRGPALLAAGRCWFLENQLQKAQPLLQRVLREKYKQADEASYWLAQSYVQQNNFVMAGRVATQGLTAFPKSVYTPRLEFIRLTSLHAQPGKRKDVIAPFAQFSQRYPTHELAARALYMATLTAVQEKQFQAAQKYASQFLNNKQFAKDKLTGEVLFLAGESWLQADGKHFAKAEPYYRRLLTDYPNHEHTAQAQLGIGLCLFMAKKRDESIKYLTPATKTLKDADARAEAWFLIGRNHSDAKRRPQAIAALETSQSSKRDWPRGDEVLLLLAENLYHTGKADQAAQRLDQLVRLYKTSKVLDQAYHQLGEMYQQQEKYQPAVTAFTTLVSRFPNSPRAPLAQHGIGLAHFNQKDYPKAITALTKQIDDYGKHTITPRSRFLRGLSYKQRKQYQPAIADLQDFLATKPSAEDALEARYSLGLCQARSNKNDDAIATFRTLLKDQPKFPKADEVQFEMAFLLLESNKKDEAMQTFRALATTYPSSPLVAKCWFSVGNYHEGKKQLPKAIEAYTLGLKTAKEKELQEKLQYKLGWVQLQAGKLTDAVKIFEQQIKDHPKGNLVDEGVYLAGEGLYQQKEYKKAVTWFDKLVTAAAKKNRDRALYRSGDCYAQLGDWVNSEKRFAALVTQFPKFERIHDARYGKGKALQRQGKFDQAKAIYEKILKETDTEPAAKSRFMIGEIAFTNKQYKKAIEHFYEAAAYPYKELQGSSHFEAARCFRELNDFAKAISTMQTFLKNHPNHRRVANAKVLLKKWEQDNDK